MQEPCLQTGMHRIGQKNGESFRSPLWSPLKDAALSEESAGHVPTLLTQYRHPFPDVWIAPTLDAGRDPANTITKLTITAAGFAFRVRARFRGMAPALSDLLPHVSRNHVP